MYRIVPVTSLRCLASPAATTTAKLAPCRAVAFYSSNAAAGSKRLLQTQTHSSVPPREPPLLHNVGGSGIESTNFASRITTETNLPNWIPPSTPAAATITTPTIAAAAKPALTRTKFRPRKAAMSLTPLAVKQLKNLMDSPEPKMIRVSVRNRGCSGLAYHLEYVDKPAKFDEEVAQDGVRVLIDSKALFSIIGSEMDWVEDKLSAKFVFHNPNIKDQCGCGESFSIG